MGWGAEMGWREGKALYVRGKESAGQQWQWEGKRRGCGGWQRREGKCGVWGGGCGVGGGGQKQQKKRRESEGVGEVESSCNGL